MNNDQLTGRQLDILAAFEPGANGDITDNTAGSLLCDMEKAVRNLTKVDAIAPAVVSIVRKAIEQQKA